MYSNGTCTGISVLYNMLIEHKLSLTPPGSPINDASLGF